MGRQHPQRRWWAIIVALLVGTAWGTSGCGLQPPQVEIVVSPSISTLQVGERLTLSANATGAGLKYQWKLAGPPKLLEPTTDPAVVYQASEPGNVVVTVEVTDKNGQMTTKSYSFVVVRPPTPPTETPTVTPPVTATPTETPKPTPCSLQSFRPRIVGTTLPGEVKIEAPPNCATGLPHENNRVGGSYSDVPDELDIWVLVYPPDMKYYPQSPDACRELPAQRRAGRWEVGTNLGRPGVSEQFDIVAVVADAEASAFFKKWLREGCEKGQFPGLNAMELPQGIMEKHSIIVQTRGASP